MVNTVMVVLGVLLVVASFGVVFSRQAMHSALWLVAALFLVALHFALLGAHFIAVLQVLIYAGAIMVLVIFVIMLLGLRASPMPGGRGLPGYLSTLLAVVFSVVVFFAVDNRWPVVSGISPDLTSAASLDGSVEAVAQLLFTRYIYPFEIVSIVLLAAIIGAVVLAQEAKQPLPPGRGLRAMREKED